MANEYLTVMELKNSAELVGTAFADYDIQKAISAASRGIDEYTGRFFFTSVGTRYYTAAEACHLDIDDLSTAGVVTTDQDGDGVYETSWTVNTDYTFAPLNGPTDGKPYEEIRVHPYAGQRFPCFPAGVSVAGTFGWPAVPDPIIEATTIIATKLVKRKRDAPFGIVGVGIDNFAVRIARTDPDVAFLLDPFIRGSGVMIA